MHTHQALQASEVAERLQRVWWQQWAPLQGQAGQLAGRQRRQEVGQAGGHGLLHSSHLRTCPNCWAGRWLPASLQRCASGHEQAAQPAAMALQQSPRGSGPLFAQFGRLRPAADAQRAPCSRLAQQQLAPAVAHQADG